LIDGDERQREESVDAHGVAIGERVVRDTAKSNWVIERSAEEFGVLTIDAQSFKTINAASSAGRCPPARLQHGTWHAAFHRAARTPARSASHSATVGQAGRRGDEGAFRLMSVIRVPAKLRMNDIMVLSRRTWQSRSNPQYRRPRRRSRVNVKGVMQALARYTSSHGPMPSFKRVTHKPPLAPYLTRMKPLPLVRLILWHRCVNSVGSVTVRHRLPPRRKTNAYLGPHATFMNR